MAIRTECFNKRSTTSGMKTAICFWIIFISGVSGALSQTNGILVIDGKAYPDGTIIRTNPASITIRSRQGVTTIDLEQLSPEWQRKFQYDPDKARAFRQKQQLSGANSQPKTDILRNTVALVVEEVLATYPNGSVVRATFIVDPLSPNNSVDRLTSIMDRFNLPLPKSQRYYAPGVIITQFDLGTVFIAKLKAEDIVALRIARQKVQSLISSTGFLVNVYTTGQFQSPGHFGSIPRFELVPPPSASESKEVVH